MSRPYPAGESDAVAETDRPRSSGEARCARRELKRGRACWRERARDHADAYDRRCRQGEVRRAAATGRLPTTKPANPLEARLCSRWCPGGYGRNAFRSSQATRRAVAIGSCQRGEAWPQPARQRSRAHVVGEVLVVARRSDDATAGSAVCEIASAPLAGRVGEPELNGAAQISRFHLLARPMSRVLRRRGRRDPIRLSTPRAEFARGVRGAKDPRYVPRNPLRKARREHTRRDAGRREALRRRRPPERTASIPAPVQYNGPRPAAELEPQTTHVPNWISSAHGHQLLRLWGNTMVHASSAQVPSIVTRRHATVRTVTLLGEDLMDTPYAACDGTGAARLPVWLADLARVAVRDAYGPARAPSFHPNFGLLAYQGPGARVSMRHNADLFANGPIVSLGYGADCIFRLHDPEGRGRAYTERCFCSGDLLVFSTESSTVCLGHGYVPAGIGRPLLGLTAGRLSLILGVARRPSPRTHA